MLLPNILNEKGLFGRLALLQMESLATLTSDLSRLLDQADKHMHTSSTDTHALSQLTLDRLAQAVQVAMANGALLCSRGKGVDREGGKMRLMQRKQLRGWREDRETQKVYSFTTKSVKLYRPKRVAFVDSESF